MLIHALTLLVETMAQFLHLLGLLLESSFGVALAIFFVAKGHRTSKLP
jgi:hypothetical protein